jgi:hypothetical protein
VKLTNRILLLLHTIMTINMKSKREKESFRIGINVLPKFFLEDVGLEIFEVLKRSTGGGKISRCE